MLARFDNEQSPVTDALAWLDMTHGPDGQKMTLDQRFADVAARHGTYSTAAIAMSAAMPHLQAVAARCTQRMQRALSHNPSPGASERSHDFGAD